MLLTGSMQGELAISKVALPPSFGAASATPARPTAAPVRHDALPADGRFEVPPLEVGQLTWVAERALARVATGPIVRRIFTFEDRAVILLAARATQGRRAPRNPGLSRLTLELGTGLQLRWIGRLAIVAIELPYAREASA